MSTTPDEDRRSYVPFVIFISLLTVILAAVSSLAITKSIAGTPAKATSATAIAAVGSEFGAVEDVEVQYLGANSHTIGWARLLEPTENVLAAKTQAVDAYVNVDAYSPNQSWALYQMEHARDSRIDIIDSGQNNESVIQAWGSYNQTYINFLAAS